MDKHCYIYSAAQVSCQLPLSDQWMETPLIYEEKYARAKEADTKEFIVPSEARRMSKILKRAVCTSISALNESGIEQPDAIITGTGMGCLENSEKFLIDLAKFRESCLKPTLFMQSTHNTVSSLIAIILGCHGYNNTYSHKGLSFESALLDAWIQIRMGNIGTALVGSHDEVTPLMSLIMEHTQPEYGFVSETSVAMMIGSSKRDEREPIEIAHVELFNTQAVSEMIRAVLHTIEIDSIVVLGLNGNNMNDKEYSGLLDSLSPDIPIVKYRHLFGDNFSSGAMGLYTAYTLLSKGRIPEFLLAKREPYEIRPQKAIIVNHDLEAGWSVITLKRN